MNNNFSMQRFGYFACAEFKANGRQFFISVLTVAIISFSIFSLYYLNADPVIRISIPTYFSLFAIMLATLLFASTSFKKYFNRSRSVEAFMIPASKGEKFTYHYLLSVVVFPLATILVVWLITALWSVILDVKMVRIETYFLGDINAVLSIFTTLSIFLLGAVVFRKSQFLFTVLSLVGIIAITSTFMILISDIDMVRALGNWLTDKLKDMTPDEIETLARTFLTIFNLLILFTTSFIAWKRFKNLQITK